MDELTQSNLCFKALLPQHWNTDATDHITSELTESMHYRSTHTHTHTHTLLSSFNKSAQPSQMMGFKHQQYEIFICQSRRSSRTTTEGELPPDLRILLVRTGSSLSVCKQDYTETSVMLGWKCIALIPTSQLWHFVEDIESCTQDFLFFLAEGAIELSISISISLSV